MKLNRKEIYATIDVARIEQDKLWRTGRPNEAQYAFAAPHILLLEEKVNNLRKLWYSSKSEDLQIELVKIAALAVRALEEIE